MHGAGTLADKPDSDDRHQLSKPVEQAGVAEGGASYRATRANPVVVRMKVAQLQRQDPTASDTPPDEVISPQYPSSRKGKKKAARKPIIMNIPGIMDVDFLPKGMAVRDSEHGSGSGGDQKEPLKYQKLDNIENLHTNIDNFNVSFAKLSVRNFRTAIEKDISSKRPVDETDRLIMTGLSRVVEQMPLSAPDVFLNNDLKAFGELSKAFAASVLSMRELLDAAREEGALAAFERKVRPSLTLPSEAPELYVGNRGGKRGGENIVEFLRRVWMPWIEAGVLTRPDLRRLDPKADVAMSNWFQKNKPWPDDLLIKSKSEAVAMRTAELAADPDAMRLLQRSRAETRRIARALGKSG